ncbi:C2H2-type zinc finger transcription factor [Phycomyces blakesleeanus NRRL 1555(-)]|uniref:C2H2-type zinc finger transcription factor n=2 Tax=Phycomyces blakesleeanus TaxID=4837 RepID=A0A162TH02_PHYB8|nr:C2H2-type zinc finger transcription factor [Phycomyces blakesleeanus NRRL 1555(-)]OAD67073.1 C2H2-type zinc finger transcription factor [Phycomyces blakesleeanus NRRL 1555(-)]|eukprot:XP_018285113.1 C2H2-type zinc finger transcription factor [Phycomyces blakesleeanus NRRL 1555(-)]
MDPLFMPYPTLCTYCIELIKSYGKEISKDRKADIYNNSQYLAQEFNTSLSLPSNTVNGCPKGLCLCKNDDDINNLVNNTLDYYPNVLNYYNHRYIFEHVKSVLVTRYGNNICNLFDPPAQVCSVTSNLPKVLLSPASPTVSSSSPNSRPAFSKNVEFKDYELYQNVPECDPHLTASRTPRYQPEQTISPESSVFSTPYESPGPQFYLGPQKETESNPISPMFSALKTPFAPSSLPKVRKRETRSIPGSSSFSIQTPGTTTRIRKSKPKGLITEKKFKCIDCSYVTDRQHNLTRHECTHGGLRLRLKCPICDRKYWRQDNLTRHFKSFH